MPDQREDTKHMRDSIKDAVDDTRDAAHEAVHRTIAQAERTKRDLAGDEMTTSEKAASVLNQGKHQAQAEWDKAKREARGQ